MNIKERLTISKPIQDKTNFVDKQLKNKQVSVIIILCYFLIIIVFYFLQIQNWKKNKLKDIQ
jgi:hypothetical protein